MKEKIPRSLIKTISWRLIATLTTMTIVYLFTGELKLAAEIGLVEVIAKLLFYYGHERFWNWVSWGRDRHPLSRINLNINAVSDEDLVLIEKKLGELGYK